MAKQNLAYDYDLDELRAEEQSKKIAHAKGTKAFDRRSAAVFFIVFALTAAFLAAIMYGKVELSSLYSQQAQMQEELAQLENENKSLESELAQKTGLTKVEAYAEEELGLQKLNKSQIEYIKLDKQPVSEPVSQDDESLFTKIKNWFGDFLEYIGAK